MLDSEITGTYEKDLRPPAPRWMRVCGHVVVCLCAFIGARWLYYIGGRWATVIDGAAEIWGVNRILLTGLYLALPIPIMGLLAFFASRKWGLTARGALELLLATWVLSSIACVLQLRNLFGFGLRWPLWAGLGTYCLGAAVMVTAARMLGLAIREGQGRAEWLALWCLIGLCLTVAGVYLLLAR